MKTRNLVRCIPSLFAVCVLSGHVPLFAQEALASASLPGTGLAMAFVGDLNADGVEDFASGCVGWCNGTGQNEGGLVRVFSGMDGSALMEFPADSPQGRFGSRVCAAGDWNGDGVPDVAISAPEDSQVAEEAGYVAVFSGADGQMLWQLRGTQPNERLGRSLAPAGDVDGDGKPDLLVGVPYRVPSTVEVRRGGDGALIHAFSEESSLFGLQVTLAGDVNADGQDDFLFASTSGLGRAWVYSGTDYSLLHEFAGTDEATAIGVAVSGLADVNGDGHDDFLIGEDENYVGDPRLGYVRLHSGLDGSVLHEVSVGAFDYFPRSIAPAGDIDGDGTPDYVVGAPFTASRRGAIHTFSGATGALLSTLQGQNHLDELGWSVAGTGGQNFLVGAPGADLAWLLTASDGSPGQPYCTSTMNSTGAPAVMDTLGSGSVSIDDLVLLAGPVPDGQFGAFYYGSQQVQLPLGNGWRCVGGGTTGIFRFPIIPSVASQLEWAVDLAAPPSLSGQVLPGSTWNFQAWFRDPQGGGSAFNLSDAYRIVFLP